MHVVVERGRDGYWLVRSYLTGGISATASIPNLAILSIEVYLRITGINKCLFWEVSLNYVDV